MEAEKAAGKENINDTEENSNKNLLLGGADYI